ncbi:MULTISPECIES: DUF4446 family protein [unclassified Paenibacillus]|uniref:DUF4446 family protein n=1 Tax=Paenibacillus TaxID=44249 RepID=UPI0003FC6E04|nr:MULTISPECIES: DUF4446 family protein [unclassified Paenibacillus]KKC48350.1 hypothetical protein VE23_16695 [Paenibacillus sp. D9]CDN41523.1 Putative uncharacterized protein [Paenibacillus sp. P22]
MNEWMDAWMEAPYYGVAIGLLAVVVVLLFIWIAVVGRRLSKLRRQYVQVMGQTGVTSLEDVIVGLRLSLDEQQDMLQGYGRQLAEFGHLLKDTKGKIGVFRYNAFSNQGSDMSFSVAIVNEDSSGVVLTGLHGRDETYMYAKPLQQGSSAYALTEEEQKAISLALQRE